MVGSVALVSAPLATAGRATAVAIGASEPAAAIDNSTSYAMGALVLKYFPLTADGRNIDVAVTGDVDEPAAVVKDRVNSITSGLTELLTAGTVYRGYGDPSALPAIRYTVIDTKEFDTAVPTVPNFPADPNYAVKPDYRGILDGAGICDYIDRRGVDEVWLWAYQGPNQLAIAESKMSGPHGDVSNSYRLNDMPLCSRTYTVYTFNYGRRIAEAAHSHGHQLEAELASIDRHLFTDLWMGPAHPAQAGVLGRCGSVHNPAQCPIRVRLQQPDVQPQ